MGWDGREILHLAPLPIAHKVTVAKTLMTQADRVWTYVLSRDQEKQNIDEALWRAIGIPHDM